ncbi:ladderlectin-like [Colossoma macropomum]|uniref:ladderlectin-like n=1 Tax=Colossoma macropomum TaxID=42526 RepID=UPI001864B7F3|nr:ladderlectin-like [Colossoma macropomum]
MLIFLIFSGLCALPFTLSQCQNGWSQFGSRCFSVFTTSANWLASEQNCVNMGGHLASVHSSEEYTFIRALVLNVTSSNSRTWLGATDAVQEGVWVWTDGSAFDYINWSTGQPDNAGSAENCMEMNFPVNWNDVTCNSLFPSVCAKTITTTTVPSTTVPSTAVPSTAVPLTTVPSTTVPSTTEPGNVMVLRLKVISNKDLAASNSSQLLLQQLKGKLIDEGLPNNFTLRLRSINKKSP